MFLIVGEIIAIGVFCVGLYYLSENARGMVMGLGLGLQFMSLNIAASFTGDTLLSKFRIWVQAWSDNVYIRIIRKLTFELLSFFLIIIPFLLIVVIFLFAYSNGATDIVKIKIFFYALPIFFVLWTYRIGDYDSFQLNIRRVIVYTIVAIVALSSKDPVIQLSKLNSVGNNDLLYLYNEFGVLAFLALDRVGKVVIELLSQSQPKKKGIESKANLYRDIV